MGTMAELVKQLQKDMGKSIISKGVEYENVDRIATGIFDFDLPTGGGFPQGRVSIIWGDESSLKTTLAMKAIATYQKTHPQNKCVFIDVENSYSTEWGAKMGIDNSELIYVLPDTAEQVVDIVQAVLDTEDVGVIVIDSLAAMISANEGVSSADKAVVGGSGLVVGKLYRKCTLGLSKARRLGRFPTIIAINQVRTKIGVMFGDPSVMPGGGSFKFASSLTVKVHGKNIKDPKIDPGLAVFKEVTGTIQKWKVPIVSQVVKFTMATINNAEYDLEVGRVEDYASIEKYLADMGQLGKTADGKKWFLFDTEFKTKGAIKEYLISNPSELADVRAFIIGEVLKKTMIKPNDDDIVN
jgi:recombination protein RecA